MCSMCPVRAYSGLRRSMSLLTSPPGDEQQQQLEVGDRVIVGGQRRGVVRFSGHTAFAPGTNIEHVCRHNNEMLLSVGHTCNYGIDTILGCIASQTGVTICWGVLPGWWYGLELERPVGKNDGTVDGKKYFTCKPKHGVFAPPSRVHKYVLLLSVCSSRVKYVVLLTVEMAQRFVHWGNVRMRFAVGTVRWARENRWIPTRRWSARGVSQVRNSRQRQTFFNQIYNHHVSSFMSRVLYLRIPTVDCSSACCFAAGGGVAGQQSMAAAPKKSIQR